MMRIERLKESDSKQQTQMTKRQNPNCQNEESKWNNQIMKKKHENPNSKIKRGNKIEETNL